MVMPVPPVAAHAVSAAVSLSTLTDDTGVEGRESLKYPKSDDFWMPGQRAVGEGKLVRVVEHIHDPRGGNGRGGTLADD